MAHCCIIYSSNEPHYEVRNKELNMVRQFAILLAFAYLAYGCQSSKDSSPVAGGLKPVSVSMGSYTTASFSNFFIPSAYAAVSDLKLCFKRMRFKKSITDIDDPLVDENVDLDLGEVSLSSAGTTLATVNVPADTYYRIEFDLDASCASGNSVYLANDFGVYTSNEGLKIKFDGVFIVDGAESLQLGVQDILNAANAHNGAASLKTDLEAISGAL